MPSELFNFLENQEKFEQDIAQSLAEWDVSDNTPSTSTSTIGPFRSFFEEESNRAEELAQIKKMMEELEKEQKNIKRKNRYEILRDSEKSLPTKE